MSDKQIAILIAVFSFFLVIFHNATIFGGEKNISQEKSEKVKIINYFADLNLEAKSSYIFDMAKNEPIFEMNADTRLPLASLTKLMTAVVALENIPRDFKIIISSDDVAQEGDSGFFVGEVWKMSDILSVMLVSSSNDAATALSLGVELPSELRSSTPFVSLMNQKAGEIGMAQTSFFNPTGLDVSFESAGAYGSARDVAKLLEYFIKNYPEIAEATRYESLTANYRTFKNTDKLAERLPGIIAGKTGATDLAGGNLVVAIDIGLGHPVIISVLGSTEDGRFEDVKKLYEATAKTLTAE
jgi:D-alanyl-D-alanine carboxypeptidase (penicillin-binding protein 5/6)